jgi:gliding motility-associated-like protein
MKLLCTFILTVFFSGLFAQSGLNIKDGTYLVVSGNAYIRISGTGGHITLDTNANATLGNAQILLHGNWNNHGTINAGTSTVTLDGSNAQTMLHRGAGLYNLTLNNIAGAQMQNSFPVTNQTLLSAGILNTGNSDTLYLENTGTLVNEANGRYVVGNVQCKTNLNATTVSPGNTGATLQTSENLGASTITRSSGLHLDDVSYATFTLDNAQSIDRIWNVQTASTPSSPISYTFQWLSDNDNGVNLNAVQVWHENTQWDTIGTTLDATGRSASFSTMKTGRFTVGKSYVVAFVVSAVADTACFGNSTSITDLSILPGSGYTYQWDFQNDGIVDQTTTGNTSVEYPAAGNYQVKLVVTNSIGQKDSTTFTVKVNETPSVNAGDDTEIEFNTSAALNATASADVTAYNWTPSASLNDATINNPVASPKNTTVYNVTVTNNLGCTASDEIKISVAVFIPTGFTPDGDGTNDTWEIPVLESYPDAVVKIFDKAGQPGFTGGSGNYWDGTFNGKNSPTEAYYYIIDLGDGSEMLSGYVSIIRLKK